MAVSEAQKRATAKYKKENYTRVPLDLKNEEYYELKEYADNTGQAVNGIIRKLIRELITQQKQLKS